MSSRPSSTLLIVSGMLTTLVAVALARLSFGLILPPMRAALGLGYEQAGNLGTATALGYLAMVMFAGALAARRGGRISILLGLALITAGFCGLAVASNYALILTLMTALGVGTAFSYTPLISLIGAWFARRRGLAIGLLNSGVGTGMFLAGWIVPWLAATGADGWRRVWAVFGIVALGTGVCAALFLRDPPRPATPAAGAAGIDRAAVFRNPHVLTVAVIYGIIGTTYIVEAIFMYSFALAAGVAPLIAGRLAAMMGLLGILFGPVWGTISDALGRANSLALALALAFVGTLIPVLWPTLPGFAVHYLVLGVSVTGLFTSSLAACTETVEAREAPLAVSFVTVFFAGGQLIGPTGAGAIIGEAGDFHTAFALSSALIGVGLALAWRLRRLESRHPVPI